MEEKITPEVKKAFSMFKDKSRFDAIVAKTFEKGNVITPNELKKLIVSTFGFLKSHLLAKKQSIFSYKNSGKIPKVKSLKSNLFQCLNNS